MCNVNMKLKKIITVSPRGFCAGVTRSIEVVEDCLEIFGAPIYIKHAIVHNKTVIEDLEKKGAIIVEEVRDIPRGAVVVFSAHGSPPEHYKQARERDLKIIDATCPLVTKVHMEIIKYAKENKNIVYIGHKKHVEGIGVVGEAKKFGINVPIIENIEDVLNLDYPEGEEIAILTQTTLNVNEVNKIINAIKNKYSKVLEPQTKDICYATTNRQEAIKALSKKSDIIIVIGSKTSSNSNKLVSVARESGTKAYLIDSVEEFDFDWLDENDEVLGLSAGASAPEYRVQEVIDYFSDNFGVKHEKSQILSENMVFTEPIELTKAKNDKK